MEITYEPVEVVRDEVPAAYGPRIEKKLAKLTKRLAKMGAPAPTVEFGPIVHIEYPESTARDLGWSGPPFPIPTFPAFETVTVSGFEAKADGWTGVAVLDWTVNPDEAFVARFPGHEDEDDAPAVSEELRTRGAVCDHCGRKRRRNNTIVFTHDDGRTIAVGTGCVLEYLGVDPRTILMLSDFVKSMDNDDAISVTPSMDPFEFVVLAAEITRHCGFVRSGEPGSTKELTTMIGILGASSHADREFAKELAESMDMERGREKAAAIAAWLDEDETGSDFLRSARVALNGNPVEAGARHAGILAALPFSHDRHIGVVAEREAKRKAAAEANAASEFIGEIGDKLTVKGVVSFYNTYDGHYGTSARLSIVTATGNKVTTYGSGNTLFGWSTGDNVELTGKIKDHDDHADFGKSTVLERVKVKELDEDGNPLPECAAARCSLPGIACDTCGKLACPNGHGNPYWDDFLCDSCMEARWDAEEENLRRSLALNTAARVMLGGRRHHSADSSLLPEGIPA